MSLLESLLRRITEWWGPRGGVAQFHHPTGAAGHAAGWIMSTRPSNRARSRQAVDLLDVQPTDRVIELGCGPGVGVAALAARATRGLVVGVDHSAVMIRQARRRNRAAIAARRVELIESAVEGLANSDAPFNLPFDAVIAINTVGMWPDPPAQLRRAALLLRPGGRVLLVGQPRRPGATFADSQAYGAKLANLLQDAGLEHVQTRLLDVTPPAAWVLGRKASFPSREAPRCLSRSWQTNG